MTLTDTKTDNPDALLMENLGIEENFAVDAPINFSCVMFDTDENMDKFGNAMYEHIVRDESFSRELTGSNLIKDLHVKFDRQRRKLDEIIDERDEATLSAVPLESLRFQLQSPILTFTGREEFLEDLHTKLGQFSCEAKHETTTPKPTPLCVIAAAAGTGKTETVRMYIHKYGREYTHIIWIDASNFAQTKAQFTNHLATELQIKTEFHGKPKPLETIVKEIYRKLVEHDKETILLIFDNAESLHGDNSNGFTGIQSFFPPPFSKAYANSTILVTSKNKNWNHQIKIQFDPWTPTESVQFLLNQLKLPETKENLHSAAELGLLFGHLPMALSSSVNYILEKRKCLSVPRYGIKDLLENYKKGNRQVLKTRSIDVSIGAQNQTLADLWNAVFLKILKAKEGDLAMIILCIASHLKSSCISSDLFKFLYPKVPEDFLVKALELLENYFVIEQAAQDRFFSIHKIIQDVTVEILKCSSSNHNLFSRDFLNHTELLIGHSMRLVQYLEAKLNREDSYSTETEDLVANYFHVTSHLSYDLSTKDCENLTTSLDVILIQPYEPNYVQVVDLLKKLVTATQINFGPEHFETLKLKRKMADVFMSQGKYKQAMKIYKEIYKVQKKLLGKNHYETLALKACIASALRALGNYACALKKFSAVIREHEKCYAPSDPVLLAVKFNMAALQVDRGEYAEAFKMFQEVLQENAKIHTDGAKQSFALKTRGWMAGILMKQEKYDEAAKEYQALIHSTEKVRGKHHRDTLLLKCDYANALSSHGDHVTAKSIFRNVLEHQKQRPGSSNLEIAATQNSLADVLFKLGDYKSATEMYTQVERVRSKELGSDNPLTLNTKLSLVHAMSRQMPFDESINFFKEVLHRRTMSLGPRHPDTILTKQHIGHMLLEQGDFKKAARVALDVICLRKSTLADNHPYSIHIRKILKLAVSKLAVGSLFRLRIQNQKKLDEIYKFDAVKFKKEVIIIGDMPEIKVLLESSVSNGNDNDYK